MVIVGCTRVCGQAAWMIVPRRDIRHKLAAVTPLVSKRAWSQFLSATHLQYRSGFSLRCFRCMEKGMTSVRGLEQ